MVRKISVIIVTYNSYDLILDCINSVYDHNDINEDDIEVIVVDNSPEEEGLRLKRLLSDTYQDKVVFIKNENKGYGHGNNVGIRNSNGEIIAIMNPDVRITEPLFKRVSEIFEDQNVASLGFKQINGVRDFSFYRFPELFFPFTYSFKNRKDNINEMFDQHVHALSGAFVFFRRKDFVEIGMYDENFFMYYEEADTSKRINLMNKKIIYDRSKSYIHLMDHKGNFNERLLDIEAFSAKIYFGKHNLNLEKYIKLRLIEFKLHKIIFYCTGNTNRVKKVSAWINAFKKIL